VCESSERSGGGGATVDCTDLCTVQWARAAPPEEFGPFVSRLVPFLRFSMVWITHQLEASLPSTDYFLTIPEAAQRLRISRNAAYLAARRYRLTSGREGLPNIAIGGSYRVPTAALDRMADIDVPLRVS
jgi:hypothetical protein